MTCYYCVYNVKDEKCYLDIEGYPLSSDVECRHFQFDTGEDEDCEDEFDEDDPYWGDDLQDLFYEIPLEKQLKRT